MSCYFCESNFHVSQFCDIAVTNESRNNIIKSKNICHICFKPLNAVEHYSCIVNKKCYICFTKKHHTLFCPGRFLTSFKVLLPRHIDQNLIERFFQTLDPLEQLLLISILPEISYLSSLMPKIEIVNNLFYNFMIPDSAIIANYSAHFIDVSESYNIRYEKFRTFIDLISIRVILIKARIVKLHEIDLTTQELSYFLTFYTEVLELCRLKIMPEITFAEILKQIPNIEELEISETNTIIDYDWPINLLKFKVGNNFKKLKLKINNSDFHVENLHNFIKRKCLPTFEAYIFVNNDSENTWENLKQKLQKYFIPCIFFGVPKLCVSVASRQNVPYQTIACFNLNVLPDSFI